jgi:hypothetical protein
MTAFRPVYADAKSTLETEILSLRRRLARSHRILTAGKMWPLTKGHVSARIPGTDNVNYRTYTFGGAIFDQYRRR